ncbi:YHS domain-containing protein [Cupriavidus basilensis]
MVATGAVPHREVPMRPWMDSAQRLTGSHSMNETSSQRQPHDAGRPGDGASHAHGVPSNTGHRAHGEHHGHHPHHGHEGQGQSALSAGALKDPVCGMAVSAHSSFHTEHAGILYYFCSASCQKKFEADPARYTGAPGMLRRLRRRQGQSTPVRCTRRSARIIRATAPSAG